MVRPPDYRPGKSLAPLCGVRARHGLSLCQMVFGPKYWGFWLYSPHPEVSLLLPFSEEDWIELNVLAGQNLTFWGTA